MSMISRRELASAVALRYKSSSKSQKSRILDEFVESTGLSRKHAICVLKQARSVSSYSRKVRAPRTRRRKYGAEVEQPLVSLWRLSGGLCPKRLMPFLGEFIAALERFDEIRLPPSVKTKLLCMSVSTAQRLLGRLRRSQECGVSTTLPGTLLRQQIPIRTFEDWTENRPGFMEIDLVAHCGSAAAGEFCYTLTMTDVCTGWTECAPLLNRSQITTQEAIEAVRRRLPFRLLGIDSDNGTEFINHHLKRYCDKRKITFTRCRPYKKNDQCHVEQKNGAVVRPLVGYARYEGKDAAKHLSQLYKVHRLSLNYFEPSMKLIDKSRVGARVKKSYDEAKTPWQRLQNAKSLSDENQERLRQFFLSLNPAKLRRQIQELEMGLKAHAVKLPSSETTPMPQSEKRGAAIEGSDTNAQNA